MTGDAGWRPPRWAAPVTLLLAVVGLAVSTYLTYVHFTSPAQLACPNTGLVNCLKVTTSPQSMIFGVIPVAVTGAAYYVVMTALMLPAAWRSGEPVLRRARVAGAVAGVGMVGYLVFVEFFQVDAICLWCTAVHALTVVLFVVVAIATVLARPLPDAVDDEALDDLGVQA